MVVVSNNDWSMRKSEKQAGPCLPETKISNMMIYADIILILILIPNPNRGSGGTDLSRDRVQDSNPLVVKLDDDEGDEKRCCTPWTKVSR